jgi:hypothetical protein
VSGLLDSKISVSCPTCGRSIAVRLRDVQAQRRVRCAVGHQVQLKEQGHGLQGADRAMRDLERTLKNFGGKLTFKL